MATAVDGRNTLGSFPWNEISLTYSTNSFGRLKYSFAGKVHRYSYNMPVNKYIAKALINGNPKLEKLSLIQGTASVYVIPTLCSFPPYVHDHLNQQYFYVD